MKTTHKILIGTTILGLAACENPADKTESASVSEAVQVGGPAASAQSTTYTFAPESEIKFVGSKVTGSHQGGFKSFRGEFAVENGQLSGSGQTITIDMDSIWTDSEKLTGHLKNEDFFHVAKHPQATFVLTEAKKSGESYQVSGNLTIMGNTKNITFPASVSMNGAAADITAKFDINRKDFGVVYAGMPDDLIRNEVVIELKLRAIPKS